jgi:hypothetical protein
MNTVHHAANKEILFNHLRTTRFFRKMPKPTTLIAPLLVVLSLTSGCSKPSDDPYVKLAKMEIESKLTDPGSVQYKNGFLGTSEKGEKLVCVDVNAKNGMGGYVGFATHSCSFEDPKTEKAECLSRSAMETVARAQISKFREQATSTHSEPEMQASVRAALARAERDAKELIDKAELDLLSQCNALRAKEGTIAF